MNLKINKKAEAAKEYWSPPEASQKNFCLSTGVKTKLWRNKLIQSMGKKGDCFDNAVAESFFGILKTETDNTRKLSASEVRLSIFDYIEVFYNRCVIA